MARAVATSKVSLGGAVVVAVMLLAAGCGGGDGGGGAFGDLGEDTSTLDSGGDTDGGEPGAASGERGDDPGARELEPLRFLLPDPSEPASGFTRIDAVCDSQENSGAWFTHGHPEGWGITGRGFGGSGSPLGDSIDHTFSSADGEVQIEMEPDSRPPDGPPLDASGQPFESFDYDYTIGGETTRITFDTVTTATVGDQAVEVVVADQSQAPDVVSRTEHKARLELAEIPNPAPGDEDGIRPASMVVTIGHDADEVDLTDDTVVSIVESFATPECTKERIVTQQETLLGEDIDGDGEVSGPEDLGR